MTAAQRFAARLVAADRPEDHPFCVALRDGALPLPVARAAALEIADVVACFPRFLAALLAQIPDYRQRMVLVDNLYCEHGRMRPAAVHEVTYRQFLEALGISDADAAAHRPGLPSTIYNRAVLDLCSRQPVPEALGALGVIEEIVARVSPLVARYAASIGAAGREKAHFGVHETLDLRHAAELYDLAEPFFADPSQRPLVERGMRLGLHYHLNLYTMVLEDAGQATLAA